MKKRNREFVAGWSILLEIGISRLFIFKRGLLDNLSGSGKESNSNENISPPSVSTTVICGSESKGGVQIAGRSYTENNRIVG